MIRSLVMLTLVSTCVVACSQSNPPPSAGSEQNAAPGTSATAQGAQQAAPASPETAPATSSAAARPSPPAHDAAATAAAPAPPPAPAAPQFKEVTIPAGTSLNVKLLSSLASNTSHAEDRVNGSIAKAVVIDGMTALPEGTPISGTVVEASE